MKELKHLAPFVPLGQTVLWIAFALIGFAWFRREIRSIVETVAQRIKEGASLKAGPLELGAKAEEIRAKRDAHDLEASAKRQKVEEALVQIDATPEQIIAVRQALEQAERELSISVELPDGREKAYACGEVPVFNALTDSVYCDAAGWVPPYTYGTAWFLENKVSRMRYQHIRELHRLGPGKPVRDTRPLAALGIAPGAQLRMVLLTPPTAG